MRGKGYIRDVVRARVRITPAYAGKRPAISISKREP